MSNSLWPHGLQHTRLFCSSLSPRVYSNSCPSNQWFLPIISSSFVSFSSCPQSFMASRSFPMSWFFTSGCQSRSFSFSISPSKEYSGLISFRTDCLISMLSKQLSRVFSWHNNSKASILCYPAFFWSNFHICTWVLEKPYLWLDGSLSAK